MLDAARFTVPYPEHPHFVGREDDLARLHEALSGNAPVGINPAALGNPTGVTGQGGIGKTQLAVAYAYRYQDLARSTAWSGWNKRDIASAPVSGGFKSTSLLKYITPT